MQVPIFDGHAPDRGTTSKIEVLGTSRQRHSPDPCCLVWRYDVPEALPASPFGKCLPRLAFLDLSRQTVAAMAFDPMVVDAWKALVFLAAQGTGVRNTGADVVVESSGRSRPELA